MTAGADIGLALHFYDKRLKQIRAKRRELERRLFWLRIRKLLAL